MKNCSRQKTITTTGQQLMRYLPLLLLVAATVAVYSAVFDATFMNFWDDQEYVLNNTAAKGFSWPHLKSAFSDVFIGNYAPLHIVSYMLDYSLWGMKPAGYLFHNVLLHTASGLVLYQIMRRLGYQPLLAGMAAGIFLLHPVQVESVAWVSQRKNVLAMFFFLLAWQRYLACQEGKSGRRSNNLLSLAAYVAALLSKSIAVILAPLLVLYDMSFLPEKNRRSRFVDKIPYVAAAGVFAVIALVSQTEKMGGGRGDYPGGSLITTCYTMTPVLASYIGDCLLPIDLQPYYRVQIRMHPDATFFLSMVLLMGLVALGIYLFKRNRRLFFFYSLFFIGLLPVSQIVPLITLKQDRYLYFPMLGLAGFFVELTVVVIRKYPRRQTAIALLVCLLLLPLPLLAYWQAAYWKDDLTLWSYAVRTDPENQFGWLQLSRIYTRAGDTQASFTAVRRYLQLTLKYGSLP